MEEREYLSHGVRDKSVRRHTLYNSIRRYIPKNMALRQALITQAERELRGRATDKSIIAQKESKRIAEQIIDVARANRERTDLQRETAFRNYSVSNKLYSENVRKKQLKRRENYFLTQQAKESISLNASTIGTELSQFEGELNHIISFSKRPILPTTIIMAKNSLLMRINSWAKRRLPYMSVIERKKYNNLLRRLKEVI